MPTSPSSTGVGAANARAPTQRTTSRLDEKRITVHIKTEVNGVVSISDRQANRRVGLTCSKKVLRLVKTIKEHSSEFRVWNGCEASSEEFIHADRESL